MRIKGIGGILISLEGDTNKEVRAEIAQLCDRVIKTTEENISKSEKSNPQPYL